MNELIEFVNRHVPVPQRENRLRRWALAGERIAFRGDVVLSVERYREGDDCRLVLQFESRDGAVATLPHDQLIRIGAVAMVPRALAFRRGVPLALLLELAATPAVLAHAIEVAA